MITAYCYWGFQIIDLGVLEATFTVLSFLSHLYFYTGRILVRGALEQKQNKTIHLIEEDEFQLNV